MSDRWSKLGVEQGKENYLIMARFPGAANYYLPIIHQLLRNDHVIYLASHGEAKNIFEREFPNQEKIDPEIKFLSWVLLSTANEQEVEWELPQILTLISQKPKLRIAVGEDIAGSTTSLLSRLQENKIEPDLILTTTHSQTARYHTLFPAWKKTAFITVGQPSFDALLHEDTTQITHKVREMLKIDDQAKVILYIGFPTLAVPENIRGFNLATLCDSWQTVKQLAIENPDQKFVFINKPHPREDSLFWELPEVNNRQNLPSNLQIISLSKEQWENLSKQGITTRALCAASDLVLNSNSTVGSEVTMAGTLNQKEIAVQVLPEDLEIKELMFSERTTQIIDVEATPVAESVVKLLSLLRETLFDVEAQLKIHQQQETYAKDFRFGDGATALTLAWIKVLETIWQKLHSPNL